MKVMLIHWMSTVHCFQFPSRLFNSFTEWCVLLDESGLECEVQRVVQQFLRLVFHVNIKQQFNVIEVYSFSFSLCVLPPNSFSVLKVYLLIYLIRLISTYF